MSALATEITRISKTKTKRITVGKKSVRNLIVSFGFEADVVVALGLKEEINLRAAIACSRLSVSGHDRKSGRGTSGIWPGKKKLEKAREGEPVSIVLKTSFRPLLKRQHFKDVKCQNLRCRVTRVCITTSRHVLIFLQFLYMSSLSTKISSNIEAYPSKCCSFARIYSTLRKLQHEQTTALWTPLEQSESHAISLAAKRTLNLSTSLGAVSRRWLALSDINRQSVKYMELTSLHDFHGS